MKTTGIFKIGLGAAVLIAILSLVSIKSFAHKIQKAPKTEQISDENVSVTIDSSTTSDNFSEIKDMLNEQGITVTFTDVQRNDLGEITGIKILLKDINGNQTVSQSSSYEPISQIVFGRKDGMLFIESKNMENGGFAFSNQPNLMSPFQFDNDSIIAQHFRSFGNLNLNDFFNDENGAFFFNGKAMNLDEIKKEMEKQFGNMAGNSNSYSWSFNSDDTNGDQNQFNFYDNPDTNKLIIINGKESDFKSLKKLAENNEIDTVDELKPKTAISIYGNKAKDGAIIVTTKN